MTDFVFTSPAGKSYTVSGPDGATQEQAWGILQQQLGSQQQPPAQQQPGVGSTYAGLTGRAILQGTGAVADLPDTMVSLIDRIGNKVRGAIGLSTEPDAPPPPQTGQRLAGSFADAIGFPRPNTPTQRVYTAGVSGLPVAAAMGPEALLPTLAGGAAGQAVRENGGGEMGALLASLAAGGVTGMAQGGVRGAMADTAAPAAGSREAAVGALRDEGIPLNQAQAGNGKPALLIDRASRMLTKGGEEFDQKQAEALNGAFLDRAGVPAGAKAATPDVMSAARTRIGSGMDAIEDRSGASFDTTMAGDLQRIQRDMLRTTAESDRGPIAQNIQDMIEAAGANGGTIPGAVVRQIRGNLSSLAANPATAAPASDAIEALQDAVARGSSPEDLAAYSTLRQQYRALKQIESATNATTGNISPQKMMQVLSQKANRNQTLYGKGDQSLVDLARAANKVIPDTLGNSGTPERFIAPLTLMESLQKGDMLGAGLRTAMGVAGVGGTARLLRNQAVVGALTNPRLAAAGISARGGFATGSGYGAAGDAADLFLQQLDQAEQQREAQQGRRQ